MLLGMSLHPQGGHVQRPGRQEGFMSTCPNTPVDWKVGFRAGCRACSWRAALLRRATAASRQSRRLVAARDFAQHVAHQLLKRFLFLLV